MGSLRRTWSLVGSDEFTRSGGYNTGAGAIAAPGATSCFTRRRRRDGVSRQYILGEIRKATRRDFVIERVGAQGRGRPSGHALHHCAAGLKPNSPAVVGRTVPPNVHARREPLPSGARTPDDVAGLNPPFPHMTR
jgi:hypothetical protein